MRRSAPPFLAIAVLAVAAGLARPARAAAEADRLVAQLAEEDVGVAVWSRIMALGEAAVPPLSSLAAGGQDLTRARALVLLYRLGKTDVLDGLGLLLESKSPAARREAAAALVAFIGEPLDVDPLGPVDQRARAMARWKAWWQANRRDALAKRPADRLYGKVLAVDPVAGLAVVGLAAKHGARKGMALTVRRGDQVVCSLDTVFAGRASSVARIVKLSVRVPPRVGDLAFHVAR